MDRRLTAADAMLVSELLYVPRSTVSDRVRREIVPSVKIGSRRIDVRRQIEAMLLRCDPS